MSLLPPWLRPEVVDRRREEPWPHWCSPPLVEAQRDLIRDYAEVIRPSRIENLVAGHARGWESRYRNLAVVRCRRCASAVGSLDLWGVGPVPPDDPPTVTMWVGGALYRGTRRCTDARLDIARSYAATAGTSVRTVPMDAQYLACVEFFTQHLPHQFPAWCARHGATTVALAKLRKAVVGGRADPDGASITIRV